MKRRSPDPMRDGSWDQAEQNHLAMGRKLTFREKLCWLEDTAKIVEYLARGAHRDTPRVVRKK